jgi:hypothetical protein
VNAQHAADADRVEPPFVNQTANRFGVDTELVGDLTNAHKVLGLFRGRHATINLQHPRLGRASLRKARCRPHRNGDKRSAHIVGLDLAALVWAVRPQAQRRE